MEVDPLFKKAFTGELEEEKYKRQCSDLLDIMSEFGILLWVSDLSSGQRIRVDKYNVFPTNLEENDINKYLLPEDGYVLDDLVSSIKSGKELKGHAIVRARIEKDSDNYHTFDVFCMARYSKGVLTHIASAVRDISEDTTIKQKQNSNEETLKLLLKARDTIQYEYDVEKDMIYTENDPFFPGKTYIPMTEYEKILAPSSKGYQNVLKMRAGLDEVINAEWKMKGSNDKDWYHMSFTNIPVQKDDRGRVTKYSGLRRDNTRMVRLLDKVEETNHLFSEVLDRLPCLFFMKDVEDDFRYSIANAMFCRALGRKKHEVEGITDRDMFPNKEEFEHFRLDDEEAIECGMKSIVEETQWAEGRKVWHTVKYLLTATTGKRYLLGMSIDITSLEDAMKELQVAKEKAEMADNLKSSFLANMSHEIRTPLNSILGFSELLIDCEDKAEKEQYGKIVASNGAQLLRIINDVLDLSKIEAGYLKLNVKPVDLTSLLQDAEMSFTPKMKREVKFLIDCPYSRYIVQADKERLLQVVNNFISNSIKYTEKGYIKVGYGSIEQGVRIYVEDTGCGIAEENHPKVFGRFNKLDSFSQGTGLGLSICKVIAESAGGMVGFDSEEGKGSTFWVYLPTTVEI